MNITKNAAEKSAVFFYTFKISIVNFEKVIFL